MYMPPKGTIKYIFVLRYICLNDKLTNILPNQLEFVIRAVE